MLSTTKEHSLLDRLSTTNCEHLLCRRLAVPGKTFCFCSRQLISYTAFLLTDNSLLVVDNVSLSIYLSITNSCRQLNISVGGGPTEITQALLPFELN